MASIRRRRSGGIFLLKMQLVSTPPKNSAGFEPNAAPPGRFVLRLTFRAKVRFRPASIKAPQFQFQAIFITAEFDIFVNTTSETAIQFFRVPLFQDFNGSHLF